MIDRTRGKSAVDSNTVARRYEQPVGFVRLVVEVGKDAETNQRRFARFIVPFAQAKMICAFVQGLAEDARFFCKYDTRWQVLPADPVYDALNANLITLAKARLRGAGYTLPL